MRMKIQRLKLFLGGNMLIGVGYEFESIIPYFQTECKNLSLTF